MNFTEKLTSSQKIDLACGLSKLIDVPSNNVVTDDNKQCKL